VHQGKSAGFLHVLPFRIIEPGGLVMERKAVTTKGNQFTSACYYLATTIIKMEAAFDLDNNITPEKLCKMIAPCITRLNVKVETKTDEDDIDAFRQAVQEGRDHDHEKTRVFFIVPLFIYLITYKFFKWYHDLTNNVGANLIGFTWGHNGCKRLFEHMSWDNKEESEWFGMDISGKDQSSQSAELNMSIADALLLLDFVSMDDKWKKINQALLLYVAQNTSSHYVRWYGNAFRIVIGCLFSGDYNTSDYNTKHIIRMWFSYILHAVPREHWKTALTHVCLRLSVQGDDIFGRIPKSLRQWLSGKGFAQYMLERHQHKIKPGSFLSSDSPLTQFDPRTGRILGGSMIKLLQRYFRLNEVTGWPEPFRPTFVIISKLFGATKAVTPGLFLSKCIGLAYDTMGTNPHCYDLIQKAFDAVVVNYHVTTEEIRNALVSSSDSLFRSTSFKWGLSIDAQSFHTFPRRQAIYDMFNVDPTSEDIKMRVSREPKKVFVLGTIE